MGFFKELQQIKELSSRTSETMGGIFSDPLNEIATVISVSDPKKLSRVKVEYQDGTGSDWVYVLGSNKGLLSAQYIGATCLIGKANANSSDAFVLGFFNKSTNNNITGAPLQLTTITEQDGANAFPTSPGDHLECNEGNAGRIYLLSNTVNNDAVICMRRNNRQETTEDTWTWKSLTSGKWVEKGFAGNSPSNFTNLSQKLGIPTCSIDLEGEVHEFTEDQKFRSFQIKCQRDENNNFNWVPTSAPPVFFRTTLPNCTEKHHGVEAVVDSGDNSQLVICLRYQGQMKWVQQGKREPLQFYSQNAPLSKEQFLSVGSVDNLIQAASPASGDFIGRAAQAALTVAGGAITPFSPTSGLSTAMGVAQLLPGAFNGSNVLRDVASTVLAANSSSPISAIASKLTNALANNGTIDDDLRQILQSVGGAGDVLARGIQTNNIEGALEDIGRIALGQALDSISAEASSVYSGYMAAGALGAIDSAVLLGLSELPREVNQFLSPAISAGRNILANRPVSMSNIINAAIGAGGFALSDVVSGLTASQLPFASQALINQVQRTLTSGDLGEIAQTIGAFSNLPGISKIPGFDNIPQLASTAAELIGIGKDFTGLLQGGIGLSGLESFIGSNPIPSLLKGVGGIGQMFGIGAGGQCPCDPKCRKTEHSTDSSGRVLLEQCGNVVATSHSSFAPEGDPTQNNNNPLSKVLDLIPTKIGEDLCVGNPYDLTKIIKMVKRLSEMADRFEGAKEADYPEFFTELTYTFEAIEKALKQADNNITGVESIERKLIDAQYRLLNKFMSRSFSYFPQALRDVRENSQAIKDLYKYVLLLDKIKNGGYAKVAITPSIGAAFANIVQIPKLSAQSRAEANLIINSAIKPAHAEWKALTPGDELLNLADIILGAFNPSVPLNFNRCKTKRDKKKVLKDSLESKLNSPVPPDPGSVFEASVPERISRPTILPSSPTSTTPSLLPGSTANGSISSLLDQIRYDQGRAQRGEADC